MQIRNICPAIFFLLSKYAQLVSQESLEQVVPRHATVLMQQAALGIQESVTVRDVIQDGQETAVKVNDH